MGAQFIGATAVARSGASVTPPTPFRDNLGDQHILITGELMGSQTISAPAGWTAKDADINAPQQRAFQFDNVTGNNTTSVPTINWGTGAISYAYILTFTGLTPQASSTDTNGDRVANVTNCSIVGPASSRTPSGPCVAIQFGAVNKTTASNGNTYTKPSGWDAMAVADSPAGNNTTHVAAAYWIQNSPTTIAANTVIAGTGTDVSSTMQGSLIVLKAASGAALAGDAVAGASASGTLTSTIAGGATVSATASAALTTAIKAAASAGAGAAVTGALTNWTTVTLAGVQYTGAGGIHDPALQAQGFNPSVGTTISYDATNATIYSNGEISAITNNCSFVAQYYDGSVWRIAIIIITPQMVSYANVVAAATAALTTATLMASAAVAVATSTGNLGSAIHLAGSALAVANASSAMLTNIVMTASAFSNTSASGALSGGQASLQSNANVLTSALAQLTAKIQLAAQVAVNSVVAGAVATQVVLQGAAAALSNAAAQITVGIQLAGNVIVASSASGATLIVTNFAGAANAVSNAMGSLLAGLRVAGDAISSVAVSGDLSTGIPLAGAAEADTAAALQPVGAEGQFGFVQINILSPTGLPVDLAVFIAGSACIVQISYFNSKGDPFVPTRVQYSVIDINSGFVIIPYTDVGQPDLADAITIPGTSNLMISNSRDSEQHRILFKITDVVGSINYASAIFELDAVPGVLN